jgi:hypothetical protein
MSRPWIAQPKEPEEPKFDSSYRDLALRTLADDWMIR